MGDAEADLARLQGRLASDGEVSETCTHRFRRGIDDGMHERG